MLSWRALNSFRFNLRHSRRMEWTKNRRMVSCVSSNVQVTVVSHKYALPPFFNLSLCTKCRGGAYTRDVTICLAIMPCIAPFQ